MLDKRPDNWFRLGFGLVVFWAVLGFTEILLTVIAIFNSRLDTVMVQQGYITSLRGMLLLLIFVAVIVMTSLLRRGLVIAPLIWAAQVLRVAFSGQWQDMVSRMLFVSSTLNLFLIVIGPALISVLLWQGLEFVDNEVSTGILVIPGLWLLLTGLVSAGNLFAWHWSLQFGLGVWPLGFGLIPLLVGFVILGFGAIKHPLASLSLLFIGLLIPTVVCMAIWGWYDGLGLALLLFLPFVSGDFIGLWLELTAMVVLPLLMVLGVNQLLAWRRGEKLLELI